jgi:hypothetical protein
VKKTRAKSWVLKRGQRERERWSARVVTLGDFKEREEESREEEEEKDHLAEIHLNFEKFKIWSKWWWWFTKM